MRQIGTKTDNTKELDESFYFDESLYSKAEMEQTTTIYNLTGEFA